MLFGEAARLDRRTHETRVSRIVQRLGPGSQRVKEGHTCTNAQQQTLPPDNDAKARTQRKLLAAAMQLVRRGRTPAVAEVALTAGVSRATAYRYFPNRSTVIAAVVAESLGPVRSYEPKARDGGQRVRELFSRPSRASRSSSRTCALPCSSRWSTNRWSASGLLEEPRYRRGFRRGLLQRAAAPLRRQLGRRRYDRLMKALSIVYGIEPYVVLKDIWGSARSRGRGDRRLDGRRHDRCGLARGRMTMGKLARSSARRRDAVADAGRRRDRRHHLAARPIGP